MRRKLLTVMIPLVSTMGMAQTTVWEDNFNDGDISDWTILDLNDDGHVWQANNDIQINGNGAPDLTIGNYDVLAVYGINMGNGAPLSNVDNSPYIIDDSAVSPAIDLSTSTGTVELVITAQSPIYDADEELDVYVSTSPDPDTFELQEIITLVREPNEDGGNSMEPQFNEFTIDISEYAGESAVYIILNTSGIPGTPNAVLGVGIEIDAVHITATEVLGLDDVTATATKIRRNPVSETLELQLGNSVSPTETTIKIYTANGMLIGVSDFNEAGIAVGHLPSGLYLASLSDGRSTESLKFIKK